MSIFASRRVPFLDNIPPSLWMEFKKASQGRSSQRGYIGHTFD